MSTDGLEATIHIDFPQFVRWIDKSCAMRSIEAVRL